MVLSDHHNKCYCCFRQYVFCLVTSAQPFPVTTGDLPVLEWASPVPQLSFGNRGASREVVGKPVADRNGKWVWFRLRTLTPVHRSAVTNVCMCCVCSFCQKTGKVLTMGCLRKAACLYSSASRHSAFCNNLIVMISISRGNSQSVSCLEDVFEDVGRKYFYIKAVGSSEYRHAYIFIPAIHSLPHVNRSLFHFSHRGVSQRGALFNVTATQLPRVIYG